jgi:hypothetical protein
VRHDGILRTSATRTLSGGTVTNNSATVLGSAADAGALLDLFAITDQATNPVVKLIVTSDDNFGSTGFRVSSMTTGLLGFFTTTQWTLDALFPGATSATADLTICANEYVLGSTVRKVLSMRHQERDIRLEESGRSQVFDRFATQPLTTVSDDPEIVVIGGIATGTDYTGAAVAIPPSETLTGASGSSVLIYPTPQSSLVLHYSYLIQRSDLTAIGSTFTADRSIETLLVKLAFARCMQDAVGDFNPEAGMALEQRILREAAALHMNQARDPGRHRILGSNFCARPGRVDFGRLPRNYGSGT